MKSEHDPLKRYALLAIDSMDRVTVLSIFTLRGRMTQEYNRRKAAGESHMIKSRVTLTIEETF